ncbi:AraC family transcriptional regulator [Vibrio fluvialis]|uniref:AraC family transcriptional regulator n=1 Tax=Vibrio fluvialis TaxID=676 RepID=UPI001EEB9767|nr:AraC family transcriptional regulator [Vibrio fluvialis]MCG6346294.1 AraC family transcriptional regulator [Vibrio fluvialis]
MKTDYHKRLLPVIRFLETNFDQPFNLEEVARMAYLSPYHFHRIFKAVMGETLNDYLRRLRMEKAANHLFYKKLLVVDVALSMGFSSSQAFAKAFKQHFGLTASQVRECDNLEAFTLLLQNSKIGHMLRKYGHDSESEAAYNHQTLITRSHQMDLQTFEPSGLAFVRVTGPYGENYEPAVGSLYGWAGPAGLAHHTSIFIYHDNPELTPADKCRTDICLLVPSGTEVPTHIEYTEFSGGKYATIRRTVTDKSQYVLYWDELMEKVVEQGLDSDDRPCFELYHECNPETGVADVSFCTAIR